MSVNEPIIQIRNIHKTFQTLRGPVHALQGDLVAAALGDLLADLLGQHGLPHVAGKTAAVDGFGVVGQHRLHEVLQDHRLEALEGFVGTRRDVGRRRSGNWLWVEHDIDVGACGHRLEPIPGFLNLCRVGRPHDVHHDVAGR